MLIAAASIGACNLSAVRVILVLRVAPIARVAREPSQTCTRAPTEHGPARSRRVAVALRVGVAGNRRAGRVVLEAGGTHLAVLAVKSSPTCAHTLRCRGAADGCRMTVTVAFAAASGLNARRVVFVVGGAALTARSSVLALAGTCAPSDKGAAHRHGVTIAVVLHIARNRGARWVALVCCRALIACCTHKTGSTRTRAPANECPTHRTRVVVAVSLLGARDGLAGRVPPVQLLGAVPLALNA